MNLDSAYTKAVLPTPYPGTMGGQTAVYESKGGKKSRRNKSRRNRKQRKSRRR